jgi:hypothetical protein
MTLAGGLPGHQFSFRTIKTVDSIAIDESTTLIEAVGKFESGFFLKRT